jgi:hypothetical protein
MAKLQGIWTQYGLEKLASLLPGENPLTIAFAAVGDGAGSLPIVEPSQTALVHEVWRGPVNGVTINPNDPTDVIVDAVIPNNVGGWFVREWGLFDDDNKLIAVGPHDEMHKPLIADGQAAEFLERFHLPVSNTGSITLGIASQSLATLAQVEAKVAERVAEHDEDASAHEGHAEIILDEGAHGFSMGQEGQSLAVQNGKLVWKDQYELCEFFPWRHPTLKPGFQPAMGGLIENAATLYPKVWAYLQTTEGQKLCVTEAQWQAMVTAIFATLADGSTIGWNGIGGAPWYAPNWDTGDLRLPDLRGMYVEAAGCDSLGVGQSHGDGIPDIWGSFSIGLTGNAHSNVDLAVGAFTRSSPQNVAMVQAGSAVQIYTRANFIASRVVQTADRVRPRSWGSLACVYLGRPSS